MSTAVRHTTAPLPARRIVCVALAACLGALLGIGPYLLYILGDVAFARWESLARPNTRVTRILGSTGYWFVDGRLWVSTDDGAIHACGYESCRREAKAQTECAQAGLWSCESEPRSLPRPPGQVVDSLVLEGAFLDRLGSTQRGRVYFVALEDGTLWLQRRVANAYRSALCGFFGLIGALGGAIAIPVYVELVLRRRGALAEGGI